MPGIDANCVLCCHCEGADTSTTLTDSSTAAHGFTNVNQAQIDTADKKWGLASALFDGTGDCFYSADSADWDVCASNADNWTIDLWIKMAAHTAANNVMVTQYQAVGARWFFEHVHGSGIHFQLVGGVNFVGGEITDTTTWHHIAMCKKAAEYGIYKDGAQVAYGTSATTASLAGSLVIGAYEPTGGQSFQGWLDEIRIYKGNYFGAAPVVGLTNTITVPTGPYNRLVYSKINGVDSAVISKLDGVAIADISKVSGI
jgi:hypothetical protein